MIFLARGTKTNKPTNKGTKYTNKKTKQKNAREQSLKFDWLSCQLQNNYLAKYVTESYFSISLFTHLLYNRYIRKGTKWVTSDLTVMKPLYRQRNNFKNHRLHRSKLKTYLICRCHFRDNLNGFSHKEPSIASDNEGTIFPFVLGNRVQNTLYEILRVVRLLKYRHSFS